MKMSKASFIAALTVLLAFTAVHGQDIVKEFSDEYAWTDPEIPQFNNLVIDKVRNTHKRFLNL